GLPGGVGALHADARDRRLGSRRRDVGPLPGGKLQRLPERDRPALLGGGGCRREQDQGRRSARPRTIAQLHVVYPLAAFAGPSPATAERRGTAGAAPRRPKRAISSRSRSFSIPAKITGTTSSVSAVEVITPPITPMAMGERNSLPGPVPIAVGTMPIAIA